MKKIAVIQLARLGDLVQTAPLLRGLRSEYDCELTLVVDKRIESAARDTGFADRVFPLDLNFMSGIVGEKGLVEMFRVFNGQFKQVFSDQYDTVYNLNRSAINSSVVSQFSADSVKGFVPERNIAGGFLHSPAMKVLFTQGHNRKYSAIHIADLYRLLAPTQRNSDGSVWKITERGKRYGVNVVSLLHYKSCDRVVALHLGAGAEIRKWGVGNFAELIEYLSLRTNAGFVLIGNEQDEAKTLLSKLSDHSRILNLTGKTDYEELAGTLSLMDLMIGSDSGPLQLAAAMGTKTLGMFFASAWVHETGPLGDGHYVIQTVPGCAPCNEDAPECGGVLCKEWIKPDLPGIIAKSILLGEEENIPFINIPQDINIFSSTRDETGQNYRNIKSGMDSESAAFYKNFWFEILTEAKTDPDPLMLNEESVEAEIYRIAKEPFFLPIAQYLMMVFEEEGAVAAGIELNRAIEKIDNLNNGFSVKEPQMTEALIS